MGKKNKEFMESVDAMKGKIEAAVKGPNAGPEIQKAVQEMLHDLTKKIPEYPKK